MGAGKLAVLVAAIIGGLHAQGVLDVPTPAVVADAAQQVRAVQDRSVAALSCRQAMLRAQDLDDPLVQRLCREPR